MDQVSPERREGATITSSIQALSQVLEQHAWEREVWGSWGQTLRAEATSLDGDIQFGVSFTREFLRSQALERMFESVFLTSMDADDKNNLLFIMKLCLLNNRISSKKMLLLSPPPPTTTCDEGNENAHHAPASSSPSAAVGSSGGDLVEQICARLVKLGESFIHQTTSRYEEWFHQRCTCDGSGIGTQEDEDLMLFAEDVLSKAATRCREAVATALGSIKVQQHHHSDGDDTLSPAAYLTDAAAQNGAGLVPLTSQDDVQQAQMSSFEGGGGVVNNGSVALMGGTTPVSTTVDSAMNFLTASSNRHLTNNQHNGAHEFLHAVHYEPQCPDVFDSCHPALGVFGLQHHLRTDDDCNAPPTRTVHTVTENTTTATTGLTASSSCTFASLLPLVEPQSVAEHDAWAQHMSWRAVQKMKEVSREVNSYIRNQQYDEEVRYRIEEQCTSAKELIPEMTSLFDRVDAYAAILETGRTSVMTMKQNSFIDVERKIDGELMAQSKLQQRLQELEEEARQVRGMIETSANVVDVYKRELDCIEKRFAEDMARFDRRAIDVSRTRREVASQRHLAHLVLLFLTGLAQKSADQTAKHLKNQETVIVQQCQFAVDQSEDAVRRLGVVVSMLDTSRSTLKDYCASMMSSTAPTMLSAVQRSSSVPNDSLSDAGGGGGVGDSIGGGSQHTPHDPAISTTSTTGAAPPSPPQARLLSSYIDDLGRVLSDRVDKCREVARNIEGLFARLEECGFEVCVDSLSPLRRMWDAVDFAGAGLLPHNTMDMGGSMLGGGAGGGAHSNMASRAHSSLDLCDVATTTTTTASTHVLPSGTDVSSSATKRKTGLPNALRNKRLRPPKSSAGSVLGGDTSSSLLVGDSADGTFQLPARVRSITSEVERLLHPHTPSWKLYNSYQ